MSEQTELPSEEIQKTRWGMDECILCAEPMPTDAGYGAQYCSKACRTNMTKLRRRRDSLDAYLLGRPGAVR